MSEYDLSEAMGDLAGALDAAALAAEAARSAEPDDLARFKSVACDLMGKITDTMGAVWEIAPPPPSPIPEAPTPAACTERARETLRWGGYCPTESSVEMMEDPEEQEAAREVIRECLATLTPGDLFAVAVLVDSLAWREDED